MWQLVFVLFSLVAHESHGLLKDGSNKAGYGDCSYTVAIYETINNLSVLKCSGTIIGEQFILTAAHCFFDDHLNFRNTTFRILSGTDDGSLSRQFKETSEVEEVRIPKLFLRSPDRYLGNIAVLKLRQPLSFLRTGSPFVKKVKLPGNYHTIPSGYSVVCGFGSASLEKGGFRVNYDETGKLYFSQVNILNITECQEHFSPNTYITSLLHICARVKQLRNGITSGTCEKDAGAPLVDHNYHVVGVRIDGSRHCDESATPALFTRVSPYIDFIQVSMNSYVTNPIVDVITLPTSK